MKLLEGLGIVLSICIIGFGIIYYGGRPLFQIIKADFAQTVVKGQPTSLVREADVPDESIDSMDHSEDIHDSVQNQYGMLICETVGLRVPVYYGDTEERLLYGAGIFSGGSVPGRQGTTLISAHDSTYFKPLENMSEGDIIEFQTKDSRYQYKVREIKIQNKRAGFTFEKMDKQELVLYTCYPFGISAVSRDERFFVYCDLLKEP